VEESGGICGGQKQVEESGGICGGRKKTVKKSTVFLKPHDLIITLFPLLTKRNYHPFALPAYI
jgi:hypothetical protein